MPKFAIEETASKEAVQYKISGVFDESAELPKILISPVINICLDSVVRLNSIGTRAWCEWVREVPDTSKIILNNCPYIFVNTFNEVFGSHTNNMQVQSLYVPFVSDSTGERKDVLFIREQHFFSDGKVTPPAVYDSLNRPMEMDVLDGYFGFLKHEKRIS